MFMHHFPALREPSSFRAQYRLALSLCPSSWSGLLLGLIARWHWSPGPGRVPTPCLWVEMVAFLAWSAVIQPQGSGFNSVTLGETAALPSGVPAAAQWDHCHFPEVHSKGMAHQLRTPVRQGKRTQERAGSPGRSPLLWIGVSASLRAPGALAQCLFGKGLLRGGRSGECLPSRGWGSEHHTKPVCAGSSSAGLRRGLRRSVCGGTDAFLCVRRTRKAP